MSLSTLRAAGLSGVDAWSRLIDAMVDRLGEKATFVILVLGISKIISGNKFQIDFQQYRIQQDRMVDPKTTREAMEGRYGAKSFIGLFLIGVPITLGQLWIYKKAYGFDLKKLPGSFGEFVWEFLKCTFFWDTSLFWIHYTLHYFPWLYKHIHKKQAFFTHIASRAHCGYELPWDPLNWVFPYCAYHDFHHLKTHYNFQTLFVFWDLLLGGNGPFWEFTRKRQAATKAAWAAKKDQHVTFVAIEPDQKGETGLKSDEDAKEE
ncbi:Cholesterol 25-hydroxylase-like protein [Gonapodya sp. JEL0774]|nr:Cholesterol 25-hydroxylase-like protein [Gonapodya sp. JEL0774]